MLVTSHVTHEEIRRLPQGIREQHEEIYDLLSNVTEVEEEKLLPRVIRAGSQLFGPLTVVDSDLAALRNLVPDEDDARHLFQAITNGVDYFVTTDQRTIISRATPIEQDFQIRVRSPSVLVAELAL